MAKQRPFIIRTPFPTEETVRKVLGLSKRDAKRITKMVDEILECNKKRKTIKKKKK